MDTSFSKKNCLNSLISAVTLGGFIYDKEYQRKDLIPLFTDNNLKAGIKYGFVTQPRYGFYKLDFLKNILMQVVIEER